MKKFLFSIGLFAAISTPLFAQEKCASQILLNQERLKNPGIILVEDSLNHLSSLITQEHSERGTIYYIPVVVHIVHDYGAEYISDAQVINAINQLNKDFNASNADTADVINVFKPIIGNAQIEFRPARFDPDGNCTNGIDRIPDESTYNGFSKPNPWPQYRYLNFWIVNNITGGNPGFATFPFSPNPLSEHGIVVQFNFFNTTSRTPTHECGHFFNLYHIWDNGNPCGSSCNGNDFVDDTPKTIGYTGCPSPAAVEVCTLGVKENYQNFMDYTNCGVMFTQGQVNRMRNALNSSEGARQSLRTDTTANFTGIMLPMVTCPPKIDFKPGYFVSICAGDSVRFQELTYGSAATGFSWAFTGGIPSGSTLPDVWVKYNTPGLYEVTLTANNTAGSSSLTKTGIVQVFANTAVQTIPLIEDFEDSMSFYNNWTVVSKSNNEWEISSLAAYDGSQSCALNNNSSNNNEIDWIISPTIDLTTAVEPIMYFARAFTIKNGSDDNLKIFYSTNCGNDWLGPIYNKSGVELATVPPDTVGFIPQSTSDWDVDTIFLSPIANESNVRFGFKFQSDKGNNIFIDNINIESISASIESTNYQISALNIFPNPSIEMTHISSTLFLQNAGLLKVIDVCGRIIDIRNWDEPMNNNGSMDIYTENYSPGVYQIIVETPLGKQTGRLIVGK
jgi:PKD repeat protein